MKNRPVFNKLIELLVAWKKPLLYTLNLIGWYFFFISPSQAQVTANFSANITGGCSPIVVQFQDLSTGNPGRWLWNFGNGGSSTLQNPQATYHSPGTYSVTLTVYGGNDSSTLTKNNFITVYQIPTVQFTQSSPGGCVPLSLTFTDQSSPGNGTLASWLWDFGDGDTASVQNPSYTYQAVGTYNVTLIVKNSYGCISGLTKPSDVTVSSGVQAGFTSSNPSCTAPYTVSFSNTTTGPATLSYQWNFGDGQSSVLQNPSHTYSSTGVYTVSLMATSSNGCKDQVTKTNLVNIASFSSNFTVPAICQGTTVTFNNTSSPVPPSSSWTFSDGVTSNTLNVSRTFSVSGDYTLKLVNTFSGGCLDSVTKSFQVADTPTADFTTPDSIGCTSPFQVNFKDQSLNAVSWFWNFGDGSTDSIQNPSHVYQKDGNYSVTLTVTNAAGCQQSLTRSDFIKISRPVASFTALPDSGCVPLPVNFNSQVTSNEPITGYFWDFGDGLTGTQANPTHTYTAEGTYSVRLLVTTASGCADTVTVPNAVMAGNPPTVQFTSSSTNSCYDIPIQFTDQSTQADKWLWSFGDNTNSSLQNPLHHFLDTGYFSVGLIITHMGCMDTLLKPKYVYINPPIAHFSPTMSCTNHYFVAFIDQSIEATSWNWNFGDGSPVDTARNPTHVYSTPGTYSVTLSVANQTCFSSDTQVIKIIDEHPDFITSDTLICHGDAVLLTATHLQTQNIASYQWTFSDGSSVTTPDSSLKKIIANPGFLDVQLVTTDSNGCRDTVFKPHFIQATGPTASFSSSSTACQNRTVNFNDQSTGYGGVPITRWVWNYGDGSSDSSAGGPFQPTYTQPNNYSVGLTVVDQSGCRNTEQQSNLVQVTPNQANFSTADTLSCGGKTILFSNLSATGNNPAYLWNFGDGNTSTSLNPSHTYTQDGNYTILLSISSGSGCTDTLTKRDYVHIGSPHAGFYFPVNYTTTCPPLVANFINDSKNYIQSAWTFGDGSSSSLDSPTHVYDLPGRYPITLTVTSYGGCQSDTTGTLAVKGPIGTDTITSAQGCSPISPVFTAHGINAVLYQWDFGDGVVSSPSTDSTTTHVYTSSGKFNPTLILTDQDGCKVSYPSNTAVVADHLTAGFAADHSLVCDSGFVHYSDSTHSFSADMLDSPSVYHWDFGDISNPADTSNNPNPSYYYNRSGTYLTQLMVTTPFGCQQTVDHSIRVAPGSTVQISGPDSTCVGTPLVYSGSITHGSNQISSWSWGFPNGQVSSLQNPSAQIFTQPGIFPVTLQITNQGGCMDTATQSLTVIPSPIIQATPRQQSVCLGQQVQLMAHDGMTYNWSPVTYLDHPQTANPISTPRANITYQVQVSNAYGCTSMDSVQIQVSLPFKITVSPDTTLCAGLSLSLQANGATRYVWSPAAGLNNIQIPNPIASPQVTTRYQVIGYGPDACFTDTATVNVQIEALPQVNAGNNQTVPVGSQVQLRASGSSDIIDWQWTPPDFLSCTNCQNPISLPKRNLTYQIKVTNGFGCMNQSEVSIHLICSQGVVFIPNTFTPNGDGMNDIFYPRGRGIKLIRFFKIYNRWGQLVFEKDNFNINDKSAGWDGTFKGQILSPDVYVYESEMVCDTDEPFLIKGNVTLLR
ncbi:MAG: PKD domain-containing protein [Chitinophagaceae bacterium]